MLITLRIWGWIFFENAFWYSGGTKICLLKQQRWSIRLAKMREKESLIEQRKSLTSWIELVILYRVITKRLITNMVVW
jgi:hypothetical protein